MTQSQKGKTHHAIRNCRKKNGANIDIYYKDWGKGQPIVFSHGWPLSADDWDPQMLFFLSKGWFFTGITSERICRARPAGEATAVMLAER